MRLRILTWHVHGNYLYYLTQAPHDFYLPVKPGKPEGYGGCLPGFDWGDNVQDIDASDVAQQDFDCIIFQSRRNYLIDQYEILLPAQQQLPRLYIEHDPPQEHPTNTRHVVDAADVHLVQVTHFNRLMWDSGQTPTSVIEHGVIVPEAVRYSGELAKGIVVVNDLGSRGRRLGADIFEQVRQEIPLDLVGMDSESLGGLGEVPHDDLPAFMAQYRFFFHPIRYTSLGLALCEAMSIGMPVVGPATTELVDVVKNGVHGYTSTRIDYLIHQMRVLLEDPTLAQGMSQLTLPYARNRFGITRFAADWDALLQQWVGPPSFTHA